MENGSEERRRVPMGRWEGLMNEEKRVEYEEKTRQRWESRGEGEWGWSEVAEVLEKTVEEVCGLGSKGVASPWTVRREREILERIEGITEKVRRRNERVGMLNARRRLRARRSWGVEQLEDDVARIRREINQARKELKRFLKGLEREWWRGVIEECEEASARGRIGDMYKCLRRLGTRERPAARSI